MRPHAIAGLALVLALGACRSRVDDATSTWFVEEAGARGLSFLHASGHDGEHFLLPESTCGGAALFDADGDGDLDAYLVQFGGVTTPRAARPPNRLFLNRGDGHFDDVTEGSGADDRGLGNGVACGDHDGDGDMDLYVTNLGPNVLLRNDGEGRFVDVSEESGVAHAGWSTSAAFFDHDGDGDLDLFVVNYVSWSPTSERECPGSRGRPDYCLPTVYDAPSADVLYRNDGDGRFTDVSQEAGISGALGTGLGVLPADFDGDGRMDVFVANDGMLDRLWLGRDGGRFEERGLDLGCAVDDSGRAKAGMGVDAGDLDDDADLDLLIGNLAGETDSLFRNELGAGRFDDVTAAAGLAGASRPLTRFGLGLFDFDADGLLDAFVANGRVTRSRREMDGDPRAEENSLHRGRPGLRFETHRARAGDTHPATSRAAAFGDVDGDGAVDALVVNRDAPAHLFVNAAPERGRWLILDVRDARGAPALGASLLVEASGLHLRRDVRAAGSYQASSDPRVHVGLGEARRTERITVSWPDGALEKFGPFDADGVVRLQRGRGVPSATR